MKLNQLNYFMEVCRWGNNITRAAEELHISQPSISHAIKELETEFGVPLFRRRNGRLQITPEGELFLAEAHALIQRVEELSQTMKQSGAEKKKITIGMPPMIGAFIFPDVCRRFLERCPDTQFEILEQGVIETHELLRNEKIDIAINFDTSADTALFRHKLLASSQFCLCVNRAHPLASASAVTVEDVAGTELCALSGNTYRAGALFNRFYSKHIEPNIVLRSNQLHTLVRTVQCGSAASLLLQEAEQSHPDIAAIPLSEPLPVEISAFWRRTQTFRRLNEFIRFIQEEY